MAKTDRDCSLSRPAIIAARASGERSDLDLLFPLISVPKDLILVEGEEVEVGG